MPTDIDNPTSTLLEMSANSPPPGGPDRNLPAPGNNGHHTVPPRLDVRELAREHATVKKQKPGHSEAQLDCLQRKLDRLLACPQQSPEFAQYLYEFTADEHYALLTAIAANFDDFAVKVLGWTKGGGKAFIESRGTQLPPQHPDTNIQNNPDTMLPQTIHRPTNAENHSPGQVGVNIPEQRAAAIAIEAATDKSPGRQPAQPESDLQTPAEAGAASSKIAAQSGPQSPPKQQRNPGGRKPKAPKLSTREPSVQSQEEPVQNVVPPAKAAPTPTTQGTNAMAEISPPVPPPLPPPSTAQRDDSPVPGKAGKPAISPLSEAEKAQLTDCELAIREGRRSFLKKCSALAEIRDQKLYRARFRTFPAYCRDVWGYAKSHANRLANCPKVVKDVSPYGDNGNAPLPTCEYQIRPLIGLLQAQVITAWRRAVELADGKPPTGALVKRAVSELPGRVKAPRTAPQKILRVPQALLQNPVNQITAVITLLKGGTVSTPAVESLEQARANLQALLDAADTPTVVKTASENNQSAHPTT